LPSEAAGNGLANPFQDPLSATGPFAADNHPAASGGGSAGSSSPAPSGSAGGSSSGGNAGGSLSGGSGAGSGGAASAPAPAAPSASSSAGTAGPSLPLSAPPPPAPAAPVNNQGTDVATIAAATTHQAVTIQSPGHRIQNVQALAPPATGVNLPLGLFGFKVLDVAPGGSATVTMILPQDVHVSSYYKQDPATGRMTPFDYDGQTGAEIHGNVVTLHFVDGARGDADSAANGIIFDPGGPGSPTFTWTNASPTPPTLTNPGNQNNAEGANVSLQLSGSSPLGYALTYDAVGLPLGLSINQSTGLISGTVDYSDAEAFAGSYSVTAIAADGHGGSVSQTFTWTITNVDRAPTITNPGNQTSAQGDVIWLQVSASDPDGDALTYQATGLPTGLSIDGNSGIIFGTVDLAAMANSPYAATITVSDGTLSASQAFTWTVGNTNRAPQVTSPGNQSNARGDAVSLQITASDSDGDALTYTASGLPPGLSIDPGTGIVSGTVANGTVTTTPYNATVTASDGALTGSQSFTWSISHLGIVSPGDQTNVNGDAVSLQILANDPDGDTLTYSATGLPPNLSISSGTGLISGTLTNSADASSPYSTTVTASDGTNTASQTFHWTVAHLSIINPGNQVTRQGSTVTLQVSGHDSDNDGLTYSASGLPPGISISASTGALSGTVGYIPNTQSPIRGPVGPGGTVLPVYSPYAVTITASDGVHSASQSFVWSVPPHVVVIDPPAQNSATLDAVNLPVTAKDSDGDILTYSASSLPAGLSINSSTGVISGTISSTADSASPYASTVRVSDGTYSTSQTFTWTVSHVFVVNPGNQANTTGDVVSVSVSARDRDGDTLTYSATGLPSGLSMNGSTGVISGTVANTADVGSPYSVAVTASDAGKSNTQSFTWSVSQHITFAATPNQSSADGDAGSLTIVAVDPDNDTLSYSASGLPSGLLINSSTGVISGTIGTTADSGSPYNVTITASDGAHTGSQTFSWVVTHVGVTNPGPLVSYDGAVVSLTIQGRDADGDTLSYSATGLPSGLSINSTTGTISGTISSTAHTASPYNVAVTASDGTHSASQSFTWTVSHVVIGFPNARTNTEGDTVSLQLSATDMDGDALTYSSSTLPAGLSLNPSTGLVSGTIAGGAASGSPYTITIAATDGTQSSSQVFSWTVNPYVALMKPSDQSNLEGASISLQLQASDAGSHTLTYTVTNLPTGLSISGSTGLISGTIATGAAAGSVYPVTVTASDGTYSQSQVFIWSVTRANNQAPVLTNPGPQSDNEGDWVSLQLSASDSDTDTLVYSASGLPAGLSIDSVSGRISGSIISSAVGQAPYAVTITTDDGNGASASQAFSWMINDAPLNAQGTTLSTTEGAQLYQVVLATFTDHYLNSPPDDFTATVNWGDGTNGVGIVSGSGGTFSVLGTHTYSTPGTPSVSIAISSSAGASATASSVVTVNSVPLSASGGAVCAIAGQTATLGLATFTDANSNDPASSYTATIVWGDGSSGSGTVTGSLGAFSVIGTHAYTTPGSYTATVTITDKDGTSISTSPAVTVGAVFAGATAQLTASPFTNVSGGTPSNSTASVVWGDGTNSAGVVSGSLNSLTVTANHSYATDGVFSVSVTVSSSTGGSQTATATVIVAPAPPGLFVTSVSETPNVPLSNLPVAAFADANANNSSSVYTATITWGDGSSSSSGTVVGTTGLFRVLGSHTYAGPGPFPITLNLFRRGLPFVIYPVNGGGGGAGAPGTTLPPLLGPTVVPGLSQYFYHLDKTAGAIVGATVSAGASIKQLGDGPGYYRFQVTYANKPARPTITITVKQGTAQPAIQLQVAVVQVKLDPQPVVTIPQPVPATSNLSKPSYFQYTPGIFTVLPESPHHQVFGVMSHYFSDGERWKFFANARGTKGLGLETTRYISSGVLINDTLNPSSHAITIKAKITLVPPDDTVDLKQINVGYIQTNTRIFDVTYGPNQTRTFTDPRGSPPPLDWNSAAPSWPWYPQPTASSAPGLASKQRNITMWDTPVIPFPEYYNELGNAKVDFTKGSGSDSFHLYVAASITMLPAPVAGKTDPYYDPGTPGARPRDDSLASRLFYEQGWMEWTVNYDVRKINQNRVLKQVDIAARNGGWVIPNVPYSIMDVDNVPADINGFFPYATYPL
jgi:hypothetical protein